MLPTFSIGSTADLAFADPNNPAAYTVDFSSNTSELKATGGFFAGGGDPVAATGGEFEVRVKLFNPRLISGVFVGDKQPGG